MQARVQGVRRGRSGIVAVAVAGMVVVGCSGSDSPETDATSTPDGTQSDVAATTPTSMGSGGVPDGVTVVGSGVAAGEPDVVRVMVGVNVQRESVQQALDDANAATDEVLATLDEHGIADEDRQTRDFSVSPSYRDGGNGQLEITGYAVRNLVEATVRDVGEVGTVVQAAAEAAGDDAQVQGVQFDLEDDGDQIVAAREAALADARDKAEQYAELTGAELGDPVAIQDHTAGSPRAALEAGQEMAADDAASSVPIEAGEQDVTVQVTVRWTMR